MPLQRVEAALEYTAANGVAQFLFTPWRALELGAPLGETACAICHRRELQSGHVLGHAHGVFEHLIAATVFIVRQCKQLLADHAAVTQVEMTDAAHPVTRLVILDTAVG